MRKSSERWLERIGSKTNPINEKVDFYIRNQWGCCNANSFCVCVLSTSKVSLGEEVLDEVDVGGEEEVVQLVYAHAERVVDVKPPAQVRAERLHLAWKQRREKDVSLHSILICIPIFWLMCLILKGNQSYYNIVSFEAILG